MRVVLLAYVFPPHPEVGALRAANLLIAFREAGHQVTLVTEPLPGQVPAIPPGPGPVPRVMLVPPGLPYATRLGRLLRRRAAPAAASPATGGGTPSAPRDLPSPGPLRRLLLAALGIPDDANYSIGAFARVGREALGAGADLLYSTAPPFSLHLSALRLRRRSAVPWVAEFRDPWTHAASSRPPALHPLTAGLDRGLERQVLRTADAIVMATEAAKRHVAPLVPAERRAGILVARNGIPDWGPVVPAERGGPFRIVHTGSLYMGRDPGDFFRALAEFVRRSGIGPAELQVELIGDARHYQGSSVVALVQQLGLADFVRFEDWLPHAAVRERLAGADALLLFAQGQPLQVPNKLYEYLAVRRPILAFVDREGESAALLERFPESHLLFGPEPEAVIGLLGRLLQRLPSPAPADPAVWTALSTRSELRRLVAELERRFAPAQSASARA
ncbi:MAG TPA: hypothetical protein VL241_11240 [Gemmatimonadales bacterium]|nr:hypothetical protein [Gemmatimonadales bacterium]